MTDRGKIYVYNALHALIRMSDSFSTLSTAARLYSLVRSPPGAAKWRELQQTFIDELDAVRVLRAMSGSKEKTADFKVIISTHTVSKSCPAIDIAIPWADIESDYENDLTDAQGTRYKIAPEVLATMGRLLQSFICSGIEPLTTRKEYSSNNCGCSVIRQLLTLRDEYALLFGADAGAPAAAADRPKSRDTPRSKPWNHMPWKSSDGPCPFQDCKGPHWKIHCPAHPSTEAGTGMAKVAAGQVTATNNEECDTFTFDDNPTLSFHDMVGLAFPNGVEERIVEVDPSTATTTARTCVATSQTPLSAREAMLGRAPEQATEPAPIAQCHSIDVPASDDDASMDDPLAKRAADSWAPCKREERPCSASFNGLPNEFCCFTCQGGQPCTRNIHQAPVQLAEGFRPSLGTVAPCKREECPCTSSFSGRPNELCCFTCQGGQPCSRNIHRAPGQPPGVAPTPPPSPPI